MRPTIAVLAALAAAGCASQPETAPVDVTSGTWVLAGKRIYTAPDAEPIDDGVVLIEGGRITAVAPAATIRLKSGLGTSRCSGGVIVAGFQNSHVHFTQPEYQGAATKPAALLAGQLEKMLGQYGVTTAVDLASDIANTVALRERIERGEIRGPRIITAGIALYPPDGIPFYLADLPRHILAQLPQPASPSAAVEVVRRNFERGAQGTKLFIATPVTLRRIKRMPEDVAQAAVAETRARGGFVFAHPTDIDGVRAAVAAGVDALAHTTIDPPKAIWDEALVHDMVARNVAVTPTLKLWPYEFAKTRMPEKIRELALGDAVAELRMFAAAGGQVLFGTDVGYMADYDPTDEYVLMARAGLTPMQILASLTTAPASRWNEETRRGRLAAGLDADIVVLDGDPSADVRHFSNVKCTFRAGRTIFADPGLDDASTRETPPP